MKLRLIFFFLITGFALCCSKNKNNTYNPIPYASVNIRIDINNPLYENLNNLGGSVYVDGQGVKGVIIVNDLNSTINAYDRACPYNFSDACALITARSLQFDLACGKYVTTTVNNKPVQTWDPCCGSVFNFDGSVKAGPSQYGLKRYTVTVNGSTINVTN